MGVNRGVFRIWAGWRRAFMVAIEPAWRRSAEREPWPFPGWFGVCHRRGRGQRPITSTSDTQRYISIESDVYGDGNEPSPGHRSIWPGAGARPSIAEGTATCGARTQSAKSALTPRVSDGRRSDSSRYAKACWQRLTPCNQRLPARAASSVNSDSRPAAR